MKSKIGVYVATFFNVLITALFSFFASSSFSSTFATDYKCPVPGQFQNVACENSITVRSLQDLISYKSNLGISTGKARNLIIDFDLNTNDLSLSTPCKITIAEKHSENLTGDLCLHGEQGVELLGYNNLNALDIRLESAQLVKINEYSKLSGLDLELVSKGSNSLSQSIIGQGSKLDLSNLLLESFDNASISSYVEINATENVRLVSFGQGNASIAEKSSIGAHSFLQSAKLQAFLDQYVSIKADSADISGATCSIFSGTSIIATEKLGSCFLLSYPNGLFVASANYGHVPLTVNFDASKVSSSKYVWSFGDGTTQTTTTPKTNYIYNKSGSYVASMKYYFDGGYKNAGSIQINVKDQNALPPVASLNCSANNMLVSCNALTSFDPQGQPLVFNFNYGDGFSETNTSGLSTHAYSVPGLYEVSLNVRNSSGLFSSATLPIQALLPPNQLPAAKLNCISSKPLNLTCDAIGSSDSDGRIVSYTYSFDDGAIVTNASDGAFSHQFATSGAHSVNLKVIDNDGGITSIDQSFNVVANSLPIADFSCTSDKPFQVSCLSNSTDPDAPNDSIVQLSWSLNNQNIITAGNTLNFNFFAGGNFPITLTATDSFGGSSSVTKMIAVNFNNPPIASFICSNTTVRSIHCASTSSDSDGVIASTSWVSDDGANFSGASFDYTFSDDLSHSITLIVADDLGSTSLLTQSVSPIKNQAPIGDIWASTLTGVAPLVVNFQAQNVNDSDGSISSITWSFSDGANVSGASVAHTFNSIGTFTATMTITDNLGASITKTLSITTLEPLKAPPIAFFKYFQEGTYLELHSYLTKTQFNFQRVYYTIDNSKTIELSEFLPNTINTLDVGSFGAHTITLTVVDIRGQVGSFTHSFNLLQDVSKITPYVAFDWIQSAPKTVFLNFNKSFTSDINEKILFYRVDFGNGVTKDITDDTFATYTYANAGTYIIKVAAITTMGTMSGAGLPVTVSNSLVDLVNPVASFYYRIYQTAQNVSFYNESSGSPNGGIISYLWDFGDGTTGVGQSAAHFYNPGSYLVKLTVTDFAGYTSSETQRITIAGLGSDLVGNIRCYDMSSRLADCYITALDKLNDINRIKITWGDNTSSLVTSALDPAQGLYKASHQYGSGGTKNIGLSITTSRGVNYSTSVNQFLYEANLPPVASLACMTSGNNVQCTASGSSDPKGLALFYDLNWGDGKVDTSTNPNFMHTYQNNGSFKAVLTVHNSAGLFSTAEQAITISQDVINPTLNCTANNLLVNCNALGSYSTTGGTLSFSFDYGDGFIDNNLSGVSSHAYSASGLYTVRVGIRSTNGAVAQTGIQVQALLPVNKLPNVMLSCQSSSPYTLECNSGGSSDPDGVIVGFQYSWDDGSVDQTSNLVISHYFKTGGTHQVSITAMDNDGGMTTVTKSFIVQENHPPIAQFYCTTPSPQKVACYSNSTDQDLGDQIVEYAWDMGDGTVITSMVPSFEHAYATSSIYQIGLRVKDSYGASAQATQQVTTIENQAPVLSLNCINITGSTFQCDVSANDVDGSIVEKSVFIDGQFVGSSDSIQYEFLNGGQHIAMARVKDDLGLVTEKTFAINVDKPIANFECVEKSTLNIICSPAATMDLSTVAIILYKIDDSEEIKDDKLDYQFSYSGSHKISAKVLSMDGKFAQQDFIFNLSKNITSPHAEFDYDVNPNLIAVFNATNSQKQEQEIASYNWDFGDGSFETNNTSIISHQYSHTGYFNVKLNVINKTGLKGEILKSIYIYNIAVNDPGEEGNNSIEGVDADNDGVRDDVQRWIAFESKDNDKLHLILNKIAQSYQLNILHYTDKVTNQEQVIKRTELNYCLKYFLNDDVLFRHYLNTMEYIYFYSEDRIFIRSNILKQATGINYPKYPNTDLEWKSFCDKNGIN